MTSRYRPTPDVPTAMRPDNLTSTNDVILAIDPGPTQSAWVAFCNGQIACSYDDGARMLAKQDNETLLGAIREWHQNARFGDVPYLSAIVIEKVEGFGMAVGAEMFETVYWSGRFAEAAFPLPVKRVGRKAVKLHLCGSMRAKDPNIRQALIDRFGGPAAIGRKATPGPLYGISGDVWSALAVAVTWSDLQRERGAA